MEQRNTRCYKKKSWMSILISNGIAGHFYFIKNNYLYETNYDYVSFPFPGSVDKYC